MSAAQGDLRDARRCWPAHAAVGLTVLRAAVEQLGAVPAGAAGSAVPEAEDLRVEPELEALARLGRGMALLECNDRGAARVEFDAALALSARHGFGYLRMQCLVLLGVVACTTGEVRSMRVVSSEALVTAAEHGWEGSRWSAAASAMLAHSELQRCAADDAKRLTADALALGRAVSSPPPLRFCLRAVHGAAAFDLGDRAVGWPSCSGRVRTWAPTRRGRSSAPRWRCWSSAPHDRRLSQWCQPALVSFCGSNSTRPMISRLITHSTRPTASSAPAV